MPLGWIDQNGADVIASSPEQFAQRLKSEIAKWGKVVREAKIRVD